MKAGFVGVIGLPNAGKSTLVNAMVGEKVSIISAKPQTTRKRITGILNQPDSQVIFVDAPGVVHAEKGLNHFLMEESEQVKDDSDVLLVLISADQGPTPSALELWNLFRETTKPSILVISRSDLKPTEWVGQIQSEARDSGREVVRVSFLKDPSRSRELVLEQLLHVLPEVESRFYPEDLFTTESMRDLAGEIIREKCFNMLEQELPYGLGVRIRQFDESNPSLYRIFADIVVEKEGHKKMVIGQGGSKIKMIGQKARKDIERFTGNQIYLELKVVVRKNWTHDETHLKELGYAINRRT